MEDTQSLKDALCMGQGAGWTGELSGQVQRGSRSLPRQELPFCWGWRTYAELAVVPRDHFWVGTGLVSRTRTPEAHCLRVPYCVQRTAAVSPGAPSSSQPRGPKPFSPPLFQCSSESDPTPPLTLSVSTASSQSQADQASHCTHAMWWAQVLVHLLPISPSPQLFFLPQHPAGFLSSTKLNSLLCFAHTPSQHHQPCFLFMHLSLFLDYSGAFLLYFADKGL